MRFLVSNRVGCEVQADRWEIDTPPRKRQTSFTTNNNIGGGEGQTAGIREALAFGFNPPPIEGLGTTGGFEVYLQNQGEGDTAELARVTQAFLGALNQDPRFAGVQTLFRANTPQINVRLDREKAKALGVPVDAVYNSLQASFGSLYVNDFNRSGCVFRVQLQADAPFRARPDDLTKLYVRSEQGAMVSLGSLLTIDYRVGAETLERFNLYPSVKLLGAPAPGRSSAEAIAAVEEIAARELPQDYAVAWTGRPTRSKRRAAQRRSYSCSASYSCSSSSPRPTSDGRCRWPYCCRCRSPSWARSWQSGGAVCRTMFTPRSASSR